MNRPPVVVKPNPGQGGGPGRVPQPPKLGRGQVLDPNRNGGNSQLRVPVRGRNGRPIAQQPLQNANGRVIAPSGNHITIINNNTYITNIRNVQGRWDRRDHDYHWYRWDDRDVCMHYDSFGFFWWGFYVGDVYFWTRYWNDYYWWYDPYWHRWCYGYDGRWWWRDPDQVDVVYVYTDNGYYQYGDTAGGVVMQPDPTPPADEPPPAEDPAPAVDQKVYTSQDGTRTVTVSNDDKQSAFLNDTADPPAFQPVWLGDGVTEVRFKNDDQGNLNEILTITADGSFGIFDKDGYAVNAAGSAPAAPQPDATTDGAPDASPMGAALMKGAAFSSLKAGSMAW